MYTIFKLSEKIVSTTKNLRKLAELRLREVSYFGNDKIRRGTFPQILFAEKEPKNLGYYDRSQNIIVLNTLLLDGGLEGNLQNVFLHELAHYCDRCINASSGHDVTFKNICDALGVEEGFSGAKVQQHIGERDGIKKKIEKLIALSSSDFQGEASSALKKAYDLAAKYSLKVDDSSDEESIFGICCASGKKMEAWLIGLSVVVANLTGVYFVRDYTVSKGLAYMFYGAKDQIELCMYMFDALLQNIEQRTEKIVSDIKAARKGFGYCSDLFELAEKEELERKYGNISRVDKNKIRLGIIMGFKSHIIEQKSKAVEMSKQANGDRYKRISGLKLKKCKGLTFSATGGYSAGYNAGTQMGIPSTAAGFTKRIGAV